MLARVRSFIEERRKKSKGGKRRGLLHLALAFLVAGALVAVLSPGMLVARADSFSVTTDGLLSSAAQIFNGLWPVFAIIAGLGLGIALVKFIVRAVQSAFGG